MRFRVATLNLEQDHKRWSARRPLILTELERLKPDILALNEVCIPADGARGLRRDLAAMLDDEVHLAQQTRVNGLAAVEGEALISRFPLVETGNLDYQTRDMVALVARLRLGDRLVDIYVTHLFMSRGDDSLRLFQVQQLLSWIERRKGETAASIVCGDFNATLDKPSAALMASQFRPSQTAPTAFTPLAGGDGAVSHPYWPRMDRCIDYIWTAGAISVAASGVCFDRPDAGDQTLWPSDHAGVWADLEL